MEQNHLRHRELNFKSFCNYECTVRNSSPFPTLTGKTLDIRTRYNSQAELPVFRDDSEIVALGSLL